LAFESVSIFSLLAADIAVVSLVWKHEAARFERIEGNRTTLQTIGMNQLTRVLQETRDEIQMNATLADTTKLQNGLHEVVALVNSQRKIRNYHPRMLLVLCLAAFASIGASIAPYFVVWQTPSGPVTLIMIALILSGVVFVSCYWFHERVQWFDERLAAGA